MDVTAPPRLFRFGLFQLDRRTGELLREGRRVRLQEQPRRVLTVLLERPGQLVTREELRQTLWPQDTFVDFEGSLNAAVKKLRSALGDSSDNPTFVETIPRRGYRFIASVAAEDVPSPTPRARRGVWPGLVAVAILSAAALVASRRPSPPAAAAGLPPVRSMVVLPLENLSDDPEQQYFADGMTDELITRLGALEGIRVISRTSAMRFKGSKKLLSQIASELDVDAVVEGSVRASGGRVRITAQLVHAPSDRQMWAESFERDERDVFRLQDEVAREIARRVTATLRPSGVLRPAVEPEAHRAFLRGRHRWHKRRDLGAAVDDFASAIAREPDFALAHAALADTYLVLPLLTPFPQHEAYPKARAAAEKALALDPWMAEAHNSHAYVKMYLDWDFAAAERGFRKAIELNPNYATAHQWYAELLSFQGRHEEAMAELRVALALDPLAAVMHFQAGQSLQQARRYDEAIQEYENAIALDPWFLKPCGHAKNIAYGRQGKLREGAEALRRAFHQEVPAMRPVIAQMEGAAVAADPRAFRLAQLEHARTAFRPACAMATVLAGLHRDEEALRLMEEALAQRLECVLFIHVDPEWDHLRSHPRFIAAEGTIGLRAAATAASSFASR